VLAKLLVAFFTLVSVTSTSSATPAGPTDVAGVPAAEVGQHGPTADVVSGQLQLVGHTDLGQNGTALGNNGGVALIGHCAYVGRWHDYGFIGPQAAIQVVDVANPKALRVLTPSPFTQFRVAHAVQREIRAVDLGSFKLLTVLTFSKFTDEGAEVPGLNAISFFGFTAGDCTRPVLLGSYRMNAIRPHEFFQWLDPNRAHNVDGHPRILEYITTPLGGVDGFVVDASNPASPSLIGVWHGGQPLASATEPNVQPPVPAGAGRYSHSISISPDGTRAYISQWDGGYFTMDTSDFASASPAPVMKPVGLGSVPILATDTPGNTHSAVRLAGTNDVVVGDEVYETSGGCPFGWMHVVDTGSPATTPSALSTFKLAENNSSACNGAMSTDRNANGQPVDGTFTMHNQTVTSRFVLTSWYGAGVRVIDVKDPTHPVEAGFFVPKPVAAISSTPDTPAPIYGLTASTDDDWWVATWSYPIVRDGLIYIADMRNGLYILRAKPGSALAKNLALYSFLEGNSNLGDLLNR